MKDDCLFCGGPADTREDIIPKWYIRRFSRQNAYFHLPNGTWIPYGKLVVPACDDDNNLFSNLEKHVQTGQFTQDEAYLWAFKIHAGLCFLGSRLKGIAAKITS